VLAFLVTALSPLQRIFDTVALTSSQWGLCIGAALVFLAFCELGKLLLRHTGSHTTPVRAAEVPAAA
jgi:Ca2+-transporting ATPase